MNIGIIGTGNVGSALALVLQQNSSCRVSMYDVRMEGDVLEGYRKVVESSDIIYLCVPSEIVGDIYDLSIVKASLEIINVLAEKIKKRLIIFIKSNMNVGETEKLDSQNYLLTLVYNPEITDKKINFEYMKNLKKHTIGIEKTFLRTYRMYIKSYINRIWPGSQIDFIERLEAEKLSCP